MMTILHSLLVKRNTELEYWLILVMILLVGLGFIAIKLTGGFIIGYRKIIVAENLKGVIGLIHVCGSLILAFALPNNYLVEIDFIRDLYERNGLWIAFSMLALAFTFFVLIGFFLTLLIKLITKFRQGFNK